MSNWLSRLKKSLSPLSSGAESEKEADRVLFSVVVLLAEIMHADHQLNSREKSVITSILKKYYGMDGSAASALFEEADRLLQGPVSLHEHTSLVNDSFDYRKKLDLINHLWQVAYADDMLDRYEEHLIRKLADLLHISHRDFIKEKHAALES